MDIGLVLIIIGLSLSLISVIVERDADVKRAYNKGFKKGLHLNVIDKSHSDKEPA